MFLDDRDLADLTDWRRALHRAPELSGEEAGTAQRVCDRLAATMPDRFVTGLGGCGVAAVYAGAEPGPTVMLRAELDGLPIEETAGTPHRSRHPGKGHLCGHDGHMAILAGVALGLGRQRPARGRAVLLFQPAEETGAGAAAVIADPRFTELSPDFAYALHNMPGLPLGHAALVQGPVACASRGMRIALTGRTAHASTPDQGISPMPAVSRLMPALAALGSAKSPGEDLAMATVTHARLGEPAFGVAPGYAEIWATLRTLTDARMAALAAQAEGVARNAAAQAALAVAIDYADVFLHCENDPEATAQLRHALEAEGVPHGSRGLPMRASEDFGRFGKDARAALFLLGAGEDHPGLHNPDFDFPDALIAVGARVFMRILHHQLG